MGLFGVVAGCSNTIRKHDLGVSFHRFPLTKTRLLDCVSVFVCLKRSISYQIMACTCSGLKRLACLYHFQAMLVCVAHTSLLKGSLIGSPLVAAIPANATRRTAGLRHTMSNSWWSIRHVNPSASCAAFGSSLQHVH